MHAPRTKAHLGLGTLWTLWVPWPSLWGRRWLDVLLLLCSRWCLLCLRLPRRQHFHLLQECHKIIAAHAAGTSGPKVRCWAATDRCLSKKTLTGGSCAKLKRYARPLVGGRLAYGRARCSLVRWRSPRAALSTACPNIQSTIPRVLWFRNPPYFSM